MTEHLAGEAGPARSAREIMQSLANMLKTARTEVLPEYSGYGASVPWWTCSSRGDAADRRLKLQSGESKQDWGGVKVPGWCFGCLRQLIVGALAKITEQLICRPVYTDMYIHSGNLEGRRVGWVGQDMVNRIGIVLVGHCQLIFCLFLRRERLPGGILRKYSILLNI